MLNEWLDIEGEGNYSSLSPTGYEVITVGEVDPNRTNSILRFVYKWFRLYCDTPNYVQRFLISVCEWFRVFWTEANYIQNRISSSGAWLRFCYANPDFVQNRISSGAYQNQEDYFRHEKFPIGSNIKIRHGDFGEAILEYHPSCLFVLPVHKLRFKHYKELAGSGFDLIGFKFAEDNNGNDVLCRGESKCRTIRDDKVITEGYEDLTKYGRAREIEQIGKIAEWLYLERRFNECEKLSRFGEGFAREGFIRRYVLVAVVDDEIPISEMIKEMNLHPRFVGGLSVCIVLINRLRNLIAKSYANELAEN
jgi:hypothetical protein